MNAKHCRSSSSRDPWYLGGESSKWYKTGNLESPSGFPALVKIFNRISFHTGDKNFYSSIAKLFSFSFSSFFFFLSLLSSKKILEFADVTTEGPGARDKGLTSYLGRDRLLVGIISARHVNENGVISLTLFSLRFDIAIHALASRYSLIVVSTVAITGTRSIRPSYAPILSSLSPPFPSPSLLFYTRISPPPWFYRAFACEYLDISRPT